MSTIKTFEGDFSGLTARVGIVVSRFNSFIVDRLLEGAVDTLKRHGIPENDLLIVKVPGAYELPLAAQKLIKSNRVDGVIALGAVIRGATPHFDYVAGECVKGLASISLKHEVPMSFGVLTTDTIEQAVERAGTKAGNKGSEAAMSLIEMISLMRKLG